MKDSTILNIFFSKHIPKLLNLENIFKMKKINKIEDNFSILRSIKVIKSGRRKRPRINRKHEKKLDLLHFHF